MEPKLRSLFLIVFTFLRDYFAEILGKTYIELNYRNQTLNFFGNKPNPKKKQKDMSINH